MPLLLIHQHSSIRMAFEWTNMSAKNVLQQKHAHSIPYWVCPPSSSLDMPFFPLIWHDFSMAHLTWPLSNLIDMHHFSHAVYMPFQSLKNFCISEFTEHCMPSQSLNGHALSVIIWHHSINLPLGYSLIGHGLLVNNRMAWRWVETLVEIRGTLADIRGTTE